MCSGMPGHRCRIVQVPAAHGRYIVCSSGMCSAKLAGQVLAKRFPEYKFNASQDAWPIPDFDTSKARASLLMTPPYCRPEAHRTSPCCSEPAGLGCKCRAPGQVQAHHAAPGAGSWTPRAAGMQSLVGALQ